jgi:hypothetical protein
LATLLLKQNVYRENRQQTTFGLTCSVSIIQLLGSKALNFPGSSGAGDVVVVLAI